MKTIIIYSSTYSCTAVIAEQMKDYLGGEVELINARKESIPPINDFQRVIIGGSLRSGQLHRQLKEFIRVQAEELTQRELGLFICSYDSGDKARQQLLAAYPAELVASAKTTAWFGRVNDFRKMNFIERMITRNIVPIRRRTSKVDFEAVRKFSRRMDRIFNPFLFIS